MSPVAEILKKESRVLTGSVESIQVHEELERRKRLCSEGKTQLISEAESQDRLAKRFLNA